jgi:hypothetical protein
MAARMRPSLVRHLGRFALSSCDCLFDLGRQIANVEARSGLHRRILAPSELLITNKSNQVPEKTFMRKLMPILSLSFLLGAGFLPDANTQQIGVEPNSLDIRGVAESVPELILSRIAESTVCHLVSMSVWTNQ